jgi:hypothetical protein
MLQFATDKPNELLQKFKRLINQKEKKGKIETWEEFEGGFRHTSEDWRKKGKFEAEISKDGKSLDFFLKKAEDHYTFSYYHGHLLQAFIEHLNNDFQKAQYTDTRSKK